MGKRSWLINIDGIDYNIEYIWRVFSKKLSVNKEHILIKKSRFLTDISETHFSLGTTDIILVHRGIKIDLVLEGKYISNGKVFLSVNDIPKWTWIFIILNTLLLLSFRFIPCIFSFIGIFLSIQISISQKFKINSKIILCSLLTIVFYELLFMLILTY